MATLSLASTNSEVDVDKVSCRICRRQFSKYTCPTCNIPYCSLTCFRSESHSQCSETFYRKEVQSDIRSEPSKTAKERLKMMELLKHFEEQSLEDDPESNLVSDEEESKEEMDLGDRLAELNLDTASSDAIWSMLTPEERKKFLQALDNPSSNLAQQLLASEELERGIQDPWWETPTVDAENGEEAGPVKRFGTTPEIMQIPSAMVRSIPTGPPLGYNMCAICIAYAYVTRHFSVSPLSSLTSDLPEHHESKRVISRLVPFLTDRKTTTLYPNLSSAVKDVWSRFNSDTVTSDSLAVFLRDAARLLRPLPVTVMPKFTSESDFTFHSHRTVILVLSDLAKLFETTRSVPDRSSVTDSVDTKNVQTQNHITHKCRFYAAHLLSTPLPVLTRLSEEAMAQSEHFRATKHVEGAISSDVANHGSPQSLTNAGDKRQLIVEL